MKKTSNIKIHLTPEDKNELVKMQKAQGFRQLSPFIHFLVFKNKKKLMQIPPQVVELKGELRMIGVNVNQIAQKLNQINFNSVEIDKTQLTSIKDNILKSTGEISAAMQKIDKYFTY